MTIYEAMGLAPGAASARFAAACSRVTAAGKRITAVYRRLADPVLPTPVPMPDRPTLPGVPFSRCLLTGWRWAEGEEGSCIMERYDHDPVPAETLEAATLPDALLSVTEQSEAWASACETITEDYIALVAATRDAALRDAEAPLAILLALPAPTPMRRRKMEVPR